MVWILLALSVAATLGVDLVIGTRLFNSMDREDRAEFAESLGLDPLRICDDWSVRRGLFLPVLIYREYVFTDEGDKELGKWGARKTFPRVKFT